MPRRRFAPHRTALAVGAAVLLLGAALAAAEWRGWPFLRAPLAQRLEAAAGVPVRLEGDFRASLLGTPSLAVGRLHVGAGGGLELPHLLQAEDIVIGWRWRDLWRAWRGDAPLTLAQVSARTLDAHLVRSADGRASWQLGRRRDAPREGAAAEPPRIGRLAVQRGRIVVDDAPLATAVELVVEGHEGGDAGTAAGWRGRLHGRWHDVPLDLGLRACAALPLLDDGPGDAAAPLWPLAVEGRAGAAQVAFDGRVAALAGARRLEGTLRLAGPSLAAAGKPLGLTLPATPPFEIAGRIGRDGARWTLDAERIVVGSSRLGGRFRFDAGAKPPRLEGRVAGPRLAFADLGPAVGAAAPGRAPPPVRRPGRVLPDRRLDLPSLRGMDADVGLAVDTLDFGTAAVGALQKVSTRIVLDDGVLTLHDLHAGAAGGRIDGTTSLDGRADAARWRADLRFEGIDVARWLPLLSGQGRRGLTPYASGIAGGALALRGEGRSTARILGTLDGSALLTLRDGTLSHLVTEAMGLDVAQALGVMVRGDDALPLRCARLDLALADGVATIRQGVLDNRDSTLRVEGSVSLRDETLALAARARPKDFSPLALRAPVTLQGSFAEPQVGIDARRLAGKLLGSIVLGAIVAPLAALVPLIDPGDPEHGDPCAPRATAAAKAQKVER